LGSEWWVIVCGLVGGGQGKSGLKELKARLAGGFGGIESFQLSASSFWPLAPAFTPCIEGHSVWLAGRVKDGYDVKGGSLSADRLVVVMGEAI
jgi:hypothetical protein